MKNPKNKNIHLTELLSRDQFQKIDSAFQRNFHLALECTDLEGQEIRSLCSPQCHPDFCKCIRASKTGLQRCRQDRLRSLNISIETGQPYITICHAGIVLGCIPVMDGDLPLGGMFFGKCIWEPFDDTLAADVRKRIKGLRIDDHTLMDALKSLPVVSARRIHEAAEFLFVLLYQNADLDPQVCRGAVPWLR